MQAQDKKNHSLHEAYDQYLWQPDFRNWANCAFSMIPILRWSKKVQRSDAVYIDLLWVDIMFLAHHFRYIALQVSMPEPSW